MHFLLLILLLLTFTIQQETSTLQSTTSVSEGNSSLLPSRQSILSASSIPDSSQPPEANIQRAIPLADKVSLEEATNNINGQWQFPNGQYIIFPVGYTAKYFITFHQDCLKNLVFFQWAATGYSFVAINDEFVKIWADPYPQTHTYTFNHTLLKCGCNTIEVHVYNYQAPSPAALLYQLSTTLVACVCQNQGVTFYNRKTCQCECSSECNCSNPAMSWFGYPWCGCMCSRSLKCPVGKYFNRQQCSCDCEAKCCPKGYYQSGITCECAKLPIYTGTIALSSTYKVTP